MGNFPTIANAIAFQATWFIAVIGAGRFGTAWPGVLGVAAFALLQLTRRDTRRADLKLMVLAATLGLIADTAFVSSGLLRYAAPSPVPGLAPAWIVALWVGLALAINHSLRWLKPRPWLAALLGACSAPLSFLAAARGWDAVAFAPPVALTLGVVALGWAAILLALVWCARRWIPVVPGSLVAAAHGASR